MLLQLLLINYHYYCCFCYCYYITNNTNNNTDNIHFFANGPKDRGSIQDRVIPKTQKTVVDASLLNT